MEMHIPSFELRKSSTTAVDRTRHSIDVSFLHCGATDLRNENDYRIYNKRFSFVICGSDHRRWTGYAFAETKPHQKMEEHWEGDGQEDPIASGSDAYGSPFLVHPDNPLYDPRAYFLVVLEIRLAGVLKDWKNLVRWVASSIEDQVGISSLLIAMTVLNNFLIRRATIPSTLLVRRRPSGACAMKIRNKPSTGFGKR